jgi:hypothetical protein
MTPLTFALLQLVINLIHNFIRRINPLIIERKRIKGLQTELKEKLGNFDVLRDNHPKTDMEF